MPATLRLTGSGVNAVGGSSYLPQFGHPPPSRNPNPDAPQYGQSTVLQPLDIAMVPSVTAKIIYFMSFWYVLRPATLHLTGSGVNAVGGGRGERVTWRGSLAPKEGILSPHPIETELGW